MTHFCILGTIFGSSEARRVKFGAQIYTDEYQGMHDTLAQGVCSGSRDSFNFWEITDNMSKTVLYIGIVTTEH